MHNSRTPAQGAENDASSSTTASVFKTQVPPGYYTNVSATTADAAPTRVVGTSSPEQEVAQAVTPWTIQVPAPGLGNFVAEAAAEAAGPLMTQAPPKKARLTTDSVANTESLVSTAESSPSPSPLTGAAADTSAQQPPPKRRVPRTRNLRHKFKPAMGDLKPPPFSKADVVIGEVYVIKGKAKAWDGRQWRKICMTALCGRYAVLSDHCKTHGGGIRCAYIADPTDDADADAAASVDPSSSEPATPASDSASVSLSASVSSSSDKVTDVGAVATAASASLAFTSSASASASEISATGAADADLPKSYTCERSAVDGSKFCKTHGGGRRCVGDSGKCGKSAAGNTNFCKAHGGGNRCIFDGCSKSAVSPTDLCINHGGGKRCWYVHPPTHRSTLSNAERKGEVPVAVVPPVERTCGKSARGSTGFCGDHIHNGQCAAPLCTRLQKLPDAKYCGKHSEMDGHPGGFANKAHRAALREIRRNHTGMAFMPRAIVPRGYREPPSSPGGEEYDTSDDARHTMWEPTEYTPPWKQASPELSVTSAATSKAMTATATASAASSDGGGAGASAGGVQDRYGRWSGEQGQQQQQPPHHYQQQQQQQQQQHQQQYRYGAQPLMMAPHPYAQQQFYPQMYAPSPYMQQHQHHPHQQQHMGTPAPSPYMQHTAHAVPMQGMPMGARRGQPVTWSSMHPGGAVPGSIPPPAAAQQQQQQQQRNVANMARTRAPSPH